MPRSAAGSGTGCLHAFSSAYITCRGPGLLPRPLWPAALPPQAGGQRAGCEGNGVRRAVRARLRATPCTFFWLQRLGGRQRGGARQGQRFTRTCERWKELKLLLQVLGLGRREVLAWLRLQVGGGVHSA